MTLAMIPIDKIKTASRLRQVTESHVLVLAESIASVGLLNPITVYRCSLNEGGIAVDGYGLIAGLHRIEACKSLGLVEIEGNIVTLDDLHRQLAEVDENLCGTKLTPSERALFTQRRKDIYIALYPETRATQNAAKRTTDNLSFVSDTASRTGVTARTVEREASRGSAIDDDVLADIRGTSLDKGVELDALAKMDKDEQRDLAARARDGQRVSARESIIARDPLNDFEAKEKWLDTGMAWWNRGSQEWRDEFIARIDTPIFDRTGAAA